MMATGGTPVVPVAGRGLAKTLQNAKFPLSATRRRGNAWAAAADLPRRVGHWGETLEGLWFLSVIWPLWQGSAIM